MSEPNSVWAPQDKSELGYKRLLLDIGDMLVLIRMYSSVDKFPLLKVKLLERLQEIKTAIRDGSYDETDQYFDGE